MVGKFQTGDSDRLDERVPRRDCDPAVMKALEASGHAVINFGEWALSGRGKRKFSRLITNPAPDPDLDPVLRTLGSLDG